MVPKIIDLESLILTGFGFYGNPFESKDPWSEENEIGKLWGRFMDYYQDNTELLKGLSVNEGEFYEVHLPHSATEITGDFEVFVGIQVLEIKKMPLEFVVKILPQSKYAVFTLKGERINSDWHKMVYHEWMPESGFSEAYSFSFQKYDHRFKGVDQLAESELDLYIPVK